MQRLDRYLLSELSLPFGIGLLTFAVIMLGDVARQMGSMLLGARVPFSLILKYLLYNAPHALSWSMPVGTVVGVSMAVTMLSNHGEITAMRAAGASFPRIFRSVLLTGLLASLLSFAFGEYLAPGASRKARDIFAQIGYNQPIVREQHNVFFHDEKGRRIFYVGHMNASTNELENISIWQSDPQGHLTSITAARWAEIRGKTWFLREGASVQLDANGDEVGPVHRFGQRKITLWAALQNYYATRRTPYEMSASELGQMIATVGPAGTNTQKLAVEYNFRYSIPLACLVFALLAGPISFRFARYGSFAGIVISILVVFLYNGARSWTLAFGLAGSLNPILAGWLPDVIFGLAGAAVLAVTR